VLQLGNLLQQKFTEDNKLITWAWAQWFFALLGLPYVQQLPVDNEIPTGVIDGVNDTFVLDSEPVTGSLQLVSQGITLFDGIGYILNGQIITYQPGYVPAIGSFHRAWYRTLS
jgi:hypothetical protein